MTQGRFIVFILGIFLSILAAAMLIPMVMDLVYQSPTWIYFGESAAITGFIGVLFILAFRPEETPTFELRQGFLLTSIGWITLSVFASLPFHISGILPSLTDAFFETVSGITTTGATVFRGLEKIPAGILLWRALLQWLGGIGIVVMAITILPTLKIGGMQLFKSEFSDRSEKYFPRVSQIASAILYTYFLLSLLCAVCYWLAGMTPFEAICTALTTVSTAGLAISDRSISYFESPFIEGIAMVFMIAGSLTLILFTRFFRGDLRAIWGDSQARVFISILALASVAMTLWLWGMGYYEFGEALRHGTFAVVTIGTTTGFTTADFTTWGTFAVIILFLLMFVGGCTGSTAGGIKIFRYQILFKAAKLQIRELRHPHGVFIPLYNNQKLKEADFMSVLAFFALYIFCYAALTLALSTCQLDFLTCLSASASALANAGPGLGPTIGPAGDYKDFPELAKWLLMFGMLVGRLELLTVIILFSPSFWRS